MDGTAANENPAVAAVDRGEPGQRRWYVRLYGDEKDFTTIWFTLDQRTLRYETYVLPEPEENRGEVYEQALKRNHKLVGAQFSIGDEHAIFLVEAVSEDELDRIVGTVYAYVEQSFRSTPGVCQQVRPLNVRHRGVRLRDFHQLFNLFHTNLIPRVRHAAWVVRGSTTPTSGPYPTSPPYRPRPAALDRIGAAGRVPAPNLCPP